MSSRDSATKNRFGDAFDHAWRCLRDSQNYARATELLGATREELEDEDLHWDDPLHRQSTMALQWLLEGRTAKILNQFDKALFCLNQAKGIYQALEDACRGHGNMINVLLEIGTLYEAIGELDESLLCQEQVLEKISLYLERGIGRVFALDSAFAYSGLGNIYLKKAEVKNDYVDSENDANLLTALAYFRKSLGFRLSDGTEVVASAKTALSYENLGLALLLLDSLDAAMHAADAAGSYLDRSKANYPTELSYLQMLYGEILMKMGDYARAKEFYRSAADIRSEVSPHYAPGRSDPLNGLARSCLAMGEYEEALQAAGEALALLEKAAPPGDYSPFKMQKIEVLSTQARIFQAKRMKGKALDRYLVISQMAADLRGEARNEQAKLHTSGNNLILDAHCEGIHLALEMYAQTQDSVFFDRAFELSERGKAAVLLESFRMNELMQVMGRGHVWMAILLRDLRQSLLEIRRLSYVQENERDLLSAAALGDSISRLRQHYDRGFQRFLSISGDKLPEVYRNMGKQNTITPQEVRKKLLSADSVAMVSYTLCGNRISTLILTQANRYAHEASLDEDFHRTLESLLVQLREERNHINIREEVANFQRASQKLYTVLISPHLDWLRENGIRRLIIIPDGPLAKLSFDVLLREGPPKQAYRELRNDYLIQEFDLSYDYSATILKERMDNHHVLNTNRVGVFAPFTFAGMRDLPQISAAAERVSECTQGRFYHRQGANREQFWRSDGRVDVVLAATHSIAVDSGQGISMLILADPLDRSRNDTVYSFEFYHRPFNVNHLFLAACETGKGTLRRGEGILSLSRGITAAGCASATVSLWAVVDDSLSTGRIMINYFAGLAGGLDKDIAMGKAKRKYLSDTTMADGNYKPYYWAEMVITGYTAPTPMEWQENRWMRVAAAGILGAILFGLGLLLATRRRRRKVLELLRFQV